MEINWTQVWAQGIATAIITPFATISTFIVMRYFPGVWERIERTVKKGVKNDKPEEIISQEIKGG